MRNNSGRFKHYVMSFSYKERREKELLKYKQRVRELKNMDSEELDFEYVTLKSKYEHKKSILTLLVITIALAILMNVWENFFIFVGKALQYASSIKDSEAEIAMVSFVISAIVVITITVLILVVLSMYMKEIYRIKKELMIIETVRDKKP